jgi:outer membrane biogenesis lipoprotein LolB
MRIDRYATLLLVAALLAGCAEGAPPPRLPTGPWQQLNDWGSQTWQPTQTELLSMPK